MSYTKIILPYKIKPSVLAFGAQSKGSFCFARGGVAYVSNSLGDLGDLENLRIFEKRMKVLQKKLRIKPQVIACDLHPEYIPTKLAKDWVKGKGGRLEAVQHHMAHIAGSIAESRIKGKVIGVSFDGTGFGLDGAIWGGEFFVGGVKGFTRVAHLKYVPMPGGEAAIREPWRMAMSYMRLLRCKPVPPRRWTSLSTSEVEQVVEQVLDKGINSPLTSSMGRLFDAVSALIGVCGVAKYEGEAAIGLEKIIWAQGSRLKAQGRYEFDYIDKKEHIIIDWGLLFKGVVKDLKAKKSKREVSLKFHNAVCCMIKDVCVLLREKYKINKVCLSGGVFQNHFLMTNTAPLLEKEGFRVYLHKRLPTHDGNIALGQAVLAGC